ncbi:hypothetical protein PF003_g24015 [Phytophthora fragariae]|nr:hypothetical protein PF003_g24015 [Phytophthora fragariae]
MTSNCPCLKRVAMLCSALIAVLYSRIPKPLKCSLIVFVTALASRNLRLESQTTLGSCITGAMAKDSPENSTTSFLDRRVEISHLGFSSWVGMTFS